MEIRSNNILILRSQSGFCHQACRHRTRVPHPVRPGRPVPVSNKMGFPDQCITGCHLLWLTTGYSAVNARKPEPVWFRISATIRSASLLFSASMTGAQKPYFPRCSSSIPIAQASPSAGSRLRVSGPIQFNRFFHSSRHLLTPLRSLTRNHFFVSYICRNESKKSPPCTRQVLNPLPIPADELCGIHKYRNREQRAGCRQHRNFLRQPPNRMPGRGA